MSGQADMAPTSYADIAQLLANNPDVDSPMARQADGSVVPVDADNTQTDEQDPQALGNDELGTGTDPDDEQSPRLRLRDTETPPARPNDRTSQKFEVTVTGDDGKEEKLTVDHQERGAGYLRHRDYTRKTQELASQSREAATLIEGKLSEGMSKAAQATQFALDAIRALAGFMSEQEMANLAVQNPQAYVAERARVDAINSRLNALQGQIEQIKQAGEQQAKEAKQRALAHCWTVLRDNEIDEKQLGAIFSDIATRYGVPRERFQNLDDPSLVLIMRDAKALNDLRAKAASVRKDGARAPVAQPRAASTRNQGDARADFARKAKAGRAGIGDLANLIGRLQQ